MCKLVLTFYTLEILDPTICYSFFNLKKRGVRKFGSDVVKEFRWVGHRRYLRCSCFEHVILRALFNCNGGTSQI
jgi:hypothetical protein